MTKTYIEMKKTIVTLMLAAAGATATVSCGNGSASDEHNDSVVSNETNDSIMIYYGRTIGGNILSQLDAYASETGDTLNKEEYLAGLQYLLDEKHSNDFLSGVAGAMRILGDMEEYKKMGITLDRSKMLEALRASLLADSVDVTRIQADGEKLGQLIQSVSDKAEERRLAAVRKSPEAVKNDRTGAAAAATALKNNPRAVKTESGIVAIIETKGKGSISDEAHLRMNMKSRHINGDVWQSTDTEQVIVPRGLAKGYAEAIKMLGIGGKGRFYIPGDLAFGPAGLAQAGVGPMEWMILDIEVVSEDDPAATSGR